VSCDAHDRLIARQRFGKLSNRMVPQVVEAQPRKWAFDTAGIGLALLAAAGVARVL
jgi:hypothetical protein